MSAAPALLERGARFDAAAFRAATGAGPAAMGDLETFRVMLADWNGRMNLVGPSALKDFWLRHAFDSAQLLDLAPRALRWVDLGPGAGFPGVVLAILLKGRPGAVVQQGDEHGEQDADQDRRAGEEPDELRPLADRVADGADQAGEHPGFAGLRRRAGELADDERMAQHVAEREQDGGEQDHHDEQVAATIAGHPTFLLACAAGW